MIKHALRTLFVGTAMLLLFTACGGGDKPKQDGPDTVTTAAIEETVPDKKVAFCIWDGAALRAEASKSGKYMSKVRLGEKVEYLEEEKTDPSNATRKYFKVALSDGSQGWVLANLFVVGGKRAVVDDNATIYKRPDLLTATEDHFSPLDLVIITNTDGDFVEVVGNKSRKKGWIKETNTTLLEVDIQMGILATMAMAEQSHEKRQKGLNDILANSDFEGSQFINYIENLLDPFEVAKTVTVSTVEEFLNAIDNNTKVILEEGEYNLSSVPDDFYPANEGIVSINGGEMSITGVQNLIIVGKGQTRTTISTEVSWSPVLDFYDGKNIMIKGLLAVHRVEKGVCSGSVISMQTTEDVTLNNLVLNGSGTVGLDLTSVTNLEAFKVDITECTEGIITLSDCRNIEFLGGSWSENSGYDHITVNGAKGLLFSNISVFNNRLWDEAYSGNGLLVSLSESSDVKFEDSSFDNNAVPQFINEDVPFEFTYVLFSGNDFSERWDGEYGVRPDRNPAGYEGNSEDEGI